VDNEPQEVSPQFRESPFWKEREKLTSTEKKALKGIRNLERLVQRRARDPKIEFNLVELTTDLYEEAFKPFGFSSRGYRQNNTVVTQGDLEYSDHNLVPRLMHSLGEETELAYRRVSKDPKDVAEIIFLVRKVHDIVYLHPFPDGNGRVARGLVHFVLRRFGYYLPNWRFAGRDGYVDAVANGYDNRQVFDRFLTQALISSYRDKETKLAKAPYDILTTRAARIRETRESLENFLGNISQPSRSDD